VEHNLGPERSAQVSSTSEPPEVFRRLFGEHYPTVVRRIAQLVRDMTVAEDLAQETFLRLYRTPPDDLSRVGPWLHRVSTRLAYSHLRNAARTRDLEARAEQAWSGNGFEPGSDVVLDQKLDRESVTRALGRLSDRDRQALLLRHSGYSYREIADILGVRQEIVGSLLMRAGERFKREYEREELEHGEHGHGDQRGPGMGAVPRASQI
jgi:RNA polymerase sigma factor (sigma-70 family)